MSRQKVLGIVVVAAVALATGFLVAGQVKAKLLTPSNQVARYQALVRSVQDLEATNAESRRRIASLNQVGDLRAHAGLTALHGPGIEVDLANGVPAPDTTGQARYLLNFQDVQDVVNLLFAQGAEAVAVSGRRITPLTAYSGSAGQVIVDQGPPLSSPIKVRAIGDRNRMLAAIDDASALPDIRARQVQFQLHITYFGSPDIALPAYDSSLRIPHVNKS